MPTINYVVAVAAEPNAVKFQLNFFNGVTPVYSFFSFSYKI